MFSRDRIEVSTRLALGENIEYLTTPWRHWVLNKIDRENCEFFTVNSSLKFTARHIKKGEIVKFWSNYLDDFTWKDRELHGLYIFSLSSWKDRVFHIETSIFSHSLYVQSTFLQISSWLFLNVLKCLKCCWGDRLTSGVSLTNLPAREDWIAIRILLNLYRYSWICLLGMGDDIW